MYLPNIVSAVMRPVRVILHTVHYYHTNICNF